MNYYKYEIDGNTYYICTERDVLFDNETVATREEYEAYIAKQNRIAEELKNKRYYYKCGNSYLNLQSPIIADGYEEITKETFNAATMPQKAIVNENLKLINYYKTELKKTDYHAIKYAEGWLTEEEYATIKAQRQEWRDKINEIETQIL